MTRRISGLPVSRWGALIVGISTPLLIFWCLSTLMSSSPAAADSKYFSALPPSNTSIGKIQNWQALPPSSDSQSPEGRLLDIYRLIGSGDLKEALNRATALTTDVPNFQLAQLVYADLLIGKVSLIEQMGDAPLPLDEVSIVRLARLRQEADRRLDSLRFRPPESAIPSQFIELPKTTKHAIAVDVSRSRMYLFKNSAQGLRLLSDFYVSIGKLGADKNMEGDQRTPTGVYYLTSRLSPSQLTPFYGAGALTLNYPNEYDQKLNRTGRGIWLHGVPVENHARSPLSTDGCVAISNNDFQRISALVEPGSTPIVIAKRLDWKMPSDLSDEKTAMGQLLENWRQAKASGNIPQLMSFYSSDFSAGKHDLASWRQTLTTELASQPKKGIEIKNLAVLNWVDRTPLLVVTFGEVNVGQRTGKVKRQYWAKNNGQWKIFFEGVIG